MKFGMLHLFETPGERSEQQMIEEQVSSMEAAEGFGVDPARSRELFDESIEVIRRAWTEERFSFEGRHYRFRDVEVRPRPLQQPHPPIWMAALSEETFEKAGRLGFNLLLSPVFGGSLQTARDRIAR